MGFTAHRHKICHTAPIEVFNTSLVAGRGIKSSNGELNSKKPSVNDHNSNVHGEICLVIELGLYFMLIIISKNMVMMKNGLIKTADT